MKKRKGKKNIAIILVLMLVLLGGATGAALVFMPAAPEIMLASDEWYRETDTFVIFNKGFGHACYYISAKDGSLYYIDGGGITQMPLQNVRELYGTEKPNAFFAITNDGELYAWGSNEYGMLGDGTGNDSDIPIKILDHISQLKITANRSIQALNTEGDVYFWGRNVRYPTLEKEVYYEPVLLPCKNVSMLVEFNIGVSRDGEVLRGLFETHEAERNPFTSFVLGEHDSLANLLLRTIAHKGVSYHLKANGDLVTLGNGLLPQETVIAQNVVDIFGYYEDSGLSYLTDSGALYSIGEIIGDGTKVPKDEFVEVRDDVEKIIHIGYYHGKSRYVLTKSGDLMGIEDVHYVTKYTNVVNTYYDDINVVLFENDRLHHYGSLDYDIEDVKAPEKLFPQLPDKVQDTLLRDAYLSKARAAAMVILGGIGSALATVLFFWFICILSKGSPNTSTSYSSAAGSVSHGKRCGDCKYLRIAPSPSGYDCSNGFFKLTDPWHDACGDFVEK